MLLFIPYFGLQSNKQVLEANTIVNKAFPQLNLRIVLSNKFTKELFFFLFKDKIPNVIRHSVIYIYIFRCAQCASEYVGRTIRPLTSETQGLQVEVLEQII